MERSDAELVRQIGRGEAQALDELVRRWYPRVWKYVYRLCGDEDDAAAWVKMPAPGQDVR